MVRRFDDRARSYDTPERVALAERVSRAIREELGGAAYETAVEYGCATGLVGLSLHDLFSMITLVDPDEDMLSCVERKIIENLIETADTLCLDLFEDDVEGLVADTVICCGSLGGAASPADALARLRSVVNEGGTLVVVDESALVEALEGACPAAGFPSTRSGVVAGTDSSDVGRSGSLSVLVARG